MPHHLPAAGLVAAFIALILSMSVGARSQPPASGPDDPAIRRTGDPFYVTWCASCAKPRYRTGQSIVFLHGDRELRFCCAECREQFKQDPNAALASLGEKLVADQLPHYPIDRSIVSDQPLGDDAVNVIWNNRLFRLRDDSERPVLLADPMKFLRSLDEHVIRVQDPIYGPGKCPVQGEFFDESEIRRIVIGNRMIKLCCANCVRVVRANPGQYLVMIDSSNREAARNRAAASQPAKP